MPLSKWKSEEEKYFFTDYINNEFDLKTAIAENLEYRLMKDRLNVEPEDVFRAAAMTLRDKMTVNWLRTKHIYHKSNSRRLYYLSMEFLMGRLLGTTLINLGIYDVCKELLEDNGWDMEEVLGREHDMGLGNGGLGRLAAGFLDSLVTLGYPAYGYGIRYQYGIFEQDFENNQQVEKPDNWLKFGSPWETMRPEHVFTIRFGGYVQSRISNSGSLAIEWVDTDEIVALAYDIPIPGYKNDVVNNLRLWEAKAAKDFDFHKFNAGDYIKSVENKNESENISKVLYPNDQTVAGKELRLKQQYFFVSASIQDIIRKHKNQNNPITNFHEKNVLQLNDTHPAIAIAELMHILLDDEHLSWATAWHITNNSFAYTNHTVLNEALEKWSVALLGKLLPRHLQIIYEINQRFLDKVRMHFRNDIEKIRNMSLVHEGRDKTIQMANLAVVGSFSVNGVAGLHTKILKNRLFKDFNEFYPEKFTNKTNGVTQRRWLLLSNPMLSSFITEKIGDKWVTDLYELKKLEKFANNKEFQNRWHRIKSANKQRLIGYIEENYDIVINQNSIFDVQIKRVHEYKRQLLNLFHVITLYNRIKENPKEDIVPRTVIFAGKAAPGYVTAKDIIYLINSVANVINNDPEVGDKLKVIFLKNYSVSLAEIIIPASDLSEQISTAGYEASGTGNMKFMLNGALTIGTLDGANIEMIEEAGEENVFIFGNDADEIFNLKLNDYFPQDFINKSPELVRIFEMIENNYFSPIDFDAFENLTQALRKDDFYCLLADYQSYIEEQRKVEKEYRDIEKWTKKSIINVARSGKFSTDRTIEEYNRDIWKLESIKI